MDKKQIPQQQDDQMFDPAHMKKQPVQNEQQGHKTLEEGPMPGEESAP